jgi:hypothetical protein
MLNLKKAAVERKLELANRFSSTIDVYLYVGLTLLIEFENLGRF